MAGAAPERRQSPNPSTHREAAAGEARPSPSSEGLVGARSMILLLPPSWTAVAQEAGWIPRRWTRLRSPTTREAEGVLRMTAEGRSSPIHPRSHFDQEGEAALIRVPEALTSPEEVAAGSSRRHQSHLDCHRTRVEARSDASSSVAFLNSSPIRRHRRIRSRRTLLAAGAARHRHRPSVPSAPSAAPRC